MPGARDTELLNYIRSYDQTPPSPPQCQFNHWGLTVYLPPELAQQFEPPAESGHAGRGPPTRSCRLSSITS
jgi:hypothetical protein